LLIHGEGLFFALPPKTESREPIMRYALLVLALLITASFARAEKKEKDAAAQDPLTMASVQFRVVYVDQDQAKELSPEFTRYEVTMSKESPAEPGEVKDQDKVTVIDHISSEPATPISVSLAKLESEGLLSTVASRTVLLAEGRETPFLLNNHPRLATSPVSMRGMLSMKADGNTVTLSLDDMPENSKPFGPLDTTFQLIDGGTILLASKGGEQRTTMESRTPILSDLPFIGSAFRREHEEVKKYSFLLFVTADVQKLQGD